MRSEELGGGGNLRGAGYLHQAIGDPSSLQRGNPSRGRLNLLPRLKKLAVLAKHYQIGTQY